MSDLTHESPSSNQNGLRIVESATALDVLLSTGLLHVEMIGWVPPAKEGKPIRRWSDMQDGKSCETCGEIGECRHLKEIPPSPTARYDGRWIFKIVNREAEAPPVNTVFIKSIECVQEEDKRRVRLTLTGDLPADTLKALNYALHNMAMGGDRKLRHAFAAPPRFVTVYRGSKKGEWSWRHDPKITTMTNTQLQTLDSRFTGNGRTTFTLSASGKVFYHNPGETRNGGIVTEPLYREIDMDEEKVTCLALVLGPEGENVIFGISDGIFEYGKYDSHRGYYRSESINKRVHAIAVSRGAKEIYYFSNNSIMMLGFDNHGRLTGEPKLIAALTEEHLTSSPKNSYQLLCKGNQLILACWGQSNGAFLAYKRQAFSLY